MPESFYSSGMIDAQPTQYSSYGEFSDENIALKMKRTNGEKGISDVSATQTLRKRRLHRIKSYFELGNDTEQQKRRLLSRHMLMLSIGGAIGTGIFLSSGQSVAISGPGSALLSFIISGIFIIAIVILLGEMCAAIPISGAYGSFAARFVDNGLGFSLGANYYLQWALTIPADVTASAIIIKYWLPNIPSYIWAIILIFPLFILQLMNVRAYGEIEYWSTCVKIVLIIFFIVVGLLYDMGAIPIARQPSPGFQNWKDGQAFFNGFAAFSQALVYAFYSYLGSELVALTSGEAINPQKTIPKAIRLAYLRMMLFNVLSILVVGLCINRSDPRLIDSATNSNVESSPIVIIFDYAGLPKAFIHVINAIILLAVLSALNSAYYASTRIIFSMARTGLLPKMIGRVNKNGIPVVAVLITLLISFLAFLTSLWGAGVVFTWLQNLISVITLIAMTFTGVINIQFRRAIKAHGKSIHDLPFRQPLYPLIPIATIFVGILFFAMQVYASARAPGSSWKTILAVLLGPATCILSYVLYWLKYPKNCFLKSPTECILVPGSIWDPELQSVLMIPAKSTFEKGRNKTFARRLFANFKYVLGNI